MCQTGQARSGTGATLASMSERDGDRARFQKDRKRKLLHRQRIRAFVAMRQRRIDERASSNAASLHMQDEGGPLRSGD